MKTPIYNQEGKQKGDFDLPANVFGIKWNDDLVHQVVSSMMSNARPNVADTKGRGEVRGGGKKPWRQKGTGQARHGSRRSPIWIGGGVTHGPNSERNFKKKINKKMKTKALGAVLSAKLADNEIVLLDNLKLSAPKAKLAAELLGGLAGTFEKIAYKTGKRVIIATPAADENLKKSFKNIKSARVEEVRNLNPLLLLNYKYLVLVEPEEGVKQLAARKK
jgi:large subunit ribosomal protein L4